MKKIVHAVMIIILLLSFFPAKGEASGNSLLIGTAQINNVNVLSLPNQDSPVITTLKKGEEFPILSTDSGDLTSPIMHSTISGDTLWKISQKFGVSLNELIELNHLSSSNILVGQRLYIPDYYLQIQLLGNKKGWVKKSDILQKNQERIIMGWKYNGNSQNYTQQLNHSNLNVVSPRWYTLSNSGNFVSIKVDTKYVKDAHNKGKKVWPLFGNKFDPIMTDSVLNNFTKRQKLVTTLKNSLVQTKSDGINVDFENIDPKNKQDFVLFITELKKVLQPHNIKVSVDVTRENIDPFWSGSLDRQKLGEVADYIILMGYEEHWGGSQIPGSIASMPWTKKGIELLMNDVPSNKIILGVPFYTREWVTNLTTKKVKSIDRTMTEVERIISSKALKKVWDQNTQQNYIEYSTNGEKHQIWMEDKQSIQLRINMVNQYKLGGVAAWYIGAETPDIWNVYHLNK
ncbi:glycosyl hydrolase family 18 protein [Bacillus sp. FJAT-22090]|uniref:glycosyl hydrolase family 18 protein n=1 Tax=Bacillus sp. FJAT-22090 TaxID=1581038 RepID=UPI0021B3C5CB|nr:glycosyl hydrolase family 18 protein [Bacillus sp. FJAT-22090]